MIKTDFIGTTKAAQCEELYNFLNDNAIEYFDSVEYDSTIPAIVCKNDNKEVLRINGNATLSTAKTAVVTFDNGTTWSSYNYNEIFKFAVKTDKGIFIQTYNTSNNTPIIEIFICKDTSGKLVVVIYGAGSSTTSQTHVLNIYDATGEFTIDYSANKTGSGIPYANSFVGMSKIPSKQNAMTAIDGLYYLLTIPVKAVYEEFIVGDILYVSNGVFALADTTV